MPPARLQPIPYPGPERLLAFVEQDPLFIEPGFRIVARTIPLPAYAGGGTLDALATDASGGVALIHATERASLASLERALAGRAWLTENLATVRALCPALHGSHSRVRCVILAGAAEPLLVTALRAFPEPRPEIFIAQCFESAAGPAVSIAPHAEARAAVPPREDVRSADPLAGVPLSREEAEEFRKISPGASPVRGAKPARDSAAGATPFGPILRGSFLEN